ncbi:MAG TPA: hypothetical protein ENF97_00170 [Candidatus Omnitrophica bacterium]|nr:hypothetical protein [Candidatus Omnitrophota bacterium]
MESEIDDLDKEFQELLDWFDYEDSEIEDEFFVENVPYEEKGGAWTCVERSDLPKNRALRVKVLGVLGGGVFKF